MRSRLALLPLFSTQIVLLLVCAPTVQCAQLVKTEFGFIQGVDYKTESGKMADVYLGIPFARPPVDDLKFEKPVPIKPWSRVLNATQNPRGCVVADPIYSALSSEDCLYFNLMKPSWKSRSPKGFPILVWIHGGSWMIGSCESYGYKAITDNFIPQGIIVVSIQYRLGPWGFMSSGDKRLPGNLGLWDQVQALKMINKIAADFGGDPSSITLMGQSAGSASVSWLSMSAFTDGLYSKAIQLSGSAYAIWTRSNEVVDFTLDLAEKVNCSSKDPNLKQCLKNTSVEAIREAMSDKGLFKQNINFAYVNPTIDGEFIRGNNFDDAITKARKRPTLISVMSQDSLFWSFEQLGLMPADEIYNLPDEEVAAFSRAKLSDFIKTQIATPFRFGSRANEAADEIISHYADCRAPKNPDNLFYFQRFTQMLSDVQFNVPALREARLKSSAGFPVYFQVYSYEKPLEVTEYPIHGSPHGAELNPLFKTLVYASFEDDDRDESIRRVFVNMLSTFVKTGKPSTKKLRVPQLTNTTFNYIDMNLPPKIKSNPFRSHYIFWERMVRKYRFDVSKGIALNRPELSIKEKKTNEPFRKLTQ